MKAMSNTFTYLVIFLTLFLYGNAFAFVEGYQTNELLTYANGKVMTSGLVLNAIGYDGNGKIFYELEKISDSDYETDISIYLDRVYIPRWDNTLDFISFTNQAIVLKSITCTGHETTDYYGNKYCLYTALGTLQYDNIVYYGGNYNSLYNATGITKTDIDTYCGLDCLETRSFENIVICFSGITQSQGMRCSGFSLNNAIYNPPTTTYAPEPFPYVAEPPAPVDALCGLDSGQITNQEPPIPPKTLCQVGTASEVVFTGTSWTWTCYGQNGGINDNCISYNTEPVDALCGLYEGNYYDEPPTTPEDFCELGTLIFPTFVETTLGWSWSCAGFNGGNNSYCNAYKNIAVFPELPEQDDCSLQVIPDRWFCEISNSLKSIFLPDANKINELQETINRINGRFPFNYLSVGRSNFLDLQENTNNDTITISLLDNEGTLNLDAVEPLAEKTKVFSQGLFVFGFLFWGLGYIKHFFK